MIVVSNRVRIPDERADAFVDRLRDSYGIEEQDGFRGLKVLAPVEADRHVTMTFWESLDDYESWRDGPAFEDAHGDRSAADVFEAPNEIEIHEVAVERAPPE